MTNLKSRIMKAVEFDEHIIKEADGNFANGMAYEQARLQPLLEALAECASALEIASQHESPPSRITVALAKLEAVLEGKKCLNKTTTNKEIK